MLCSWPETYLSMALSPFSGDLTSNLTSDGVPTQDWAQLQVHLMSHCFTAKVYNKFGKHLEPNTCHSSRASDKCNWCRLGIYMQDLRECKTCCVNLSPYDAWYLLFVFASEIYWIPTGRLKKFGCQRWLSRTYSGQSQSVPKVVARVLSPAGRLTTKSIACWPELQLVQVQGKTEQVRVRSRWKWTRYGSEKTRDEMRLDASPEWKCMEVWDEVEEEK